MFTTAQNTEPDPDRVAHYTGLSAIAARRQHTALCDEIHDLNCRDFQTPFDRERLAILNAELAALRAAHNPPNP